MSRQDLTPLLTGLIRHASQEPAQFHIPGHNKGSGLAPEMAALLGERALSLDLINIPPLDDLHNPTGIIREAQALAAEAFGADHTLFSVQGTSTAVMAMILGLCGPGDKLLLPRNVHRSVLTGIILSGASPVFMMPDLDDRLGIAHGVSPETVNLALRENPDTKALLVTNPTYFGVATDLEQIVKQAHSRAIPVLVDEAHGAHLYFHEELPTAAMHAGADLAATSVHKMGGSLTQTSMLHIREGLVDVNRVKAAMSLLTTTSTSYLLLASLDAARKQLATAGRKLLDRAVRIALRAREAINHIPSWYSFGSEILKPGTARHGFDPTKLTLSPRGLGLSGTMVESLLRDGFGIQVEMADFHHVLCVIGLGVREDEVDRLLTALEAISRQCSHAESFRGIHVTLPVVPKLALTPREAVFAAVKTVPLSEAVGAVSAESIMVYPPGVPILMPGEVICEESLAYIQQCRRAGLQVQGLADPSQQQIRVVR